jgi:hypothetical protein
LITPQDNLFAAGHRLRMFFKILQTGRTDRLCGSEFTAFCSRCAYSDRAFAEGFKAFATASNTEIFFSLPGSFAGETDQKNY